MGLNGLVIKWELLFMSLMDSIKSLQGHYSNIIYDNIVLRITGQGRSLSP